MRRDLARLANEQFDVLILGGGVTGACIARDAAIRGLKVALVEKGDFARATSASSSKLIHGGLRYLRTLEFNLVRESLRERRIWQRIAPHLVQKLPFLLPLYGGSMRVRLKFAAGLTLYDLLAFDRNRLDDPDQHLPGHRWLEKSEAAATEPLLNRPGFDGAFLYYDCQTLAPERLALECLLDADAHGAALANYVAAERLILNNGRVSGANVRDNETGAVFDIRARLIIVAAGPWADLFLEHTLGAPPAHRLVRSKGIHLLTRTLTGGHALALPTATSHLFVMPWNGYALFATTDTEYRGSPDAVGVSENDIADFLRTINGVLPQIRLARGDIRHFYAGLRPLVSDGMADTYHASRRAELVDHGREGTDGLFSVLGGKWTTSRRLAEKTVDAAVARLGMTAAPCRTADSVLPGGGTGRFAAFAEAQAAEHRGIADIATLTRLYGARLVPMLAAGGEIAFAVREEMALHLEDVVMRRTILGQCGAPPESALKQTAAAMSALLGWKAERAAHEIAAVRAHYVTQSASAA